MGSFENGHGAVILIVENDANDINVMRDYLSRAHFRVRTAGNGWEALKILKGAPVDIVISRLTMTDMDGCQLREKCVLQPETRDIPFLFLLEDEQTDSHIRALRSGVDDIIVKPFDPIVLVARVQAVLERRIAYEQLVRVDPLTRLLNRPTLFAELKEELSRVDRYKRTGSLVMIDIDDFATVNEEHGVSMGDLLLTCLSGVVLTNIRNMDFAGRYRSEKILLYLPETNDEGAETLATRMQKQLADIANSVAGFDLHFSVGIVATPADGIDLSQLLARLENALKRAKERGPGAVIIWSRDVADEAQEGLDGSAEI